MNQTPPRNVVPTDERGAAFDTTILGLLASLVDGTPLVTFQFYIHRRAVFFFKAKFFVFLFPVHLDQGAFLGGTEFPRRFVLHDRERLQRLWAVSTLIIVSLELPPPTFPSDMLQLFDHVE